MPNSGRATAGCLADAVREQMEALPYYNSFFKTTTPPTVELAAKLAQLTLRFSDCRQLADVSALAALGGLRNLSRLTLDF